jgi:fermentation-respiration switch protein FrsA (DUF1100 family)
VAALLGVGSLLAGMVGCAAERTQWHQAGAPAVAGSPTPGDAPSGTAPTSAFAVGVRTLHLSRGADRPLRTLVWYPASGPVGRAPVSGAKVAPGRYPVVLFSHGLRADPETYAAGTARLAAAGFVVVAPAYPHTNGESRPMNPVDVVNQPADASAVLDAVLALDSGGDPFAGHLWSARVAAMGHSAGGYTTAALFGIARDPRLLAGVVLSGGTIGSFRGTPAPLLFVHGEADDVVDYRTGRAAYDQDAWPKAFLTAIGGGHADYLTPDHPAFAPVLATVTDFLRWTLYGDAAAHARLAADAGKPGVTRWESTL